MPYIPLQRATIGSYGGGVLSSEVPLNTVPLCTLHPPPNAREASTCHSGPGTGRISHTSIRTLHPTPYTPYTCPQTT